jgi:hypothetical protein
MADNQLQVLVNFPIYSNSSRLSTDHNLLAQQG